MASKTRRSSEPTVPSRDDDGADEQDREPREAHDDIEPPPNERLFSTHRGTLSSRVAQG